MLLHIPEYGEEFTEQKLYEKFQVRNNGGIRPSRKNRVIILINSFFSDYQGGYEDGVDEKAGFVYYVGEGDGDQEYKRNNKSILESRQNGFTLLYFEKHVRNKIIFKFTLEYVSSSFQRQNNFKGIERNVIVFKLKII